MQIICESCQKYIPIARHQAEVTCSCGAAYRLDEYNLSYDRVVTSFFPPGEPSIEVCVAELLKALANKDEAVESVKRIRLLLADVEPGGVVEHCLQGRLLQELARGEVADREIWLWSRKAKQAREAST